MNPCELTDRQRNVLDLMSTGLLNKQIARELGISPRTVEIHRAKAMRVIGARNAIHAAMIWDRMKRAPADPAPETLARPMFKVWFDGKIITRNGEFFAECSTTEIASALALALDSAQLLFDGTVPVDLQQDVARVLWPDAPASQPEAKLSSVQAQQAHQPLEALLAADWEA